MAEYDLVLLPCVSSRLSGLGALLEVGIGVVEVGMVQLGIHPHWRAPRIRRYQKNSLCKIHACVRDELLMSAVSASGASGTM